MLASKLVERKEDTPSTNKAAMNNLPVLTEQTQGGVVFQLAGRYSELVYHSACSMESLDWPCGWLGPTCSVRSAVELYGVWRPQKALVIMQALLQMN